MSRARRDLVILWGDLRHPSDQLSMIQWLWERREEMRPR